jgi:hypothetical protein
MRKNAQVITNLQTDRNLSLFTSRQQVVFAPPAPKSKLLEQVRNKLGTSC